MISADKAETNVTKDSIRKNGNRGSSRHILEYPACKLNQKMLQYLQYHLYSFRRIFTPRNRPDFARVTIAVPPVRYGRSMCMGQTANTPRVARAEPAAMRYLGLRARA